MSERCDQKPPFDIKKIKRTFAGNYRIDDPCFEGCIFPTMEDAGVTWQKFLRGEWKNPLKEQS